MKKFIIVLFLLIGIGTGVGVVLGNSNNDTPREPSKPQVLSDQSRQVAGEVAEKKIEFGTPTTLKIPKFGINAAIESVGLDKNKAMDVPKEAANVGWYNLGGKPGETRNTVLAGHYDRIDGSPAVFWDLPKIQKGDAMTVVDENGKELTYEVTDIATYPHDAFPLKKVFGRSDESMLIVYTCQGEFDTATNIYSDRLVVYSKLISN